MHTAATSLRTYMQHLNQLLEQISGTKLQAFVDLVATTLQANGTIFVIGNGGDAATASHWAVDLGKGLHHKAGLHLKVQSLTDNVPWITAVANDIGYESIFSDQLRAQGKPGDLLVALSVSGNSPNIIKTQERAKQMGIASLSIVGSDGGKAKEISDHVVHIPSKEAAYGPVEDIQLILGHFLSEYLSRIH